MDINFLHVDLDIESKQDISLIIDSKISSTDEHKINADSIYSNTSEG